MARFIREDDYDVQVRTEIARIIDPTAERRKLMRAEDMAISQVRNFIASRYDCDKVFTPAVEGQPDDRNQYIVMLVIDLSLYHLWSKEGGNNIPKTRELRYTDALDWLKAIQGGQPADLPKLTDSNGATASDIRIWSLRTQEDNRF